MGLDTINGFLEEIDYLRKKSDLLDEILKYYDMDTMTFNVPDFWRNLHMESKEQLKKDSKNSTPCFE